MSSAIHCFRTHKDLFTSEERKALRSESKTLAAKKKITPQEAMIQVVRGRRDELQEEYNGIAKVIRKHYGVPPVKAAPPVKKAPPKKERRKDVILRKKIDELSSEEKKFVIAELRRMNEAQRKRIAKLRDVAHNDPLTGLLNRRGLKEKTGKRKPYHVFMDLIGFKSINDTVSHEAGDTVLEAIAKGMRAIGVDNPTRWGGDELVFQANSNEVGEVKAQELQDYFKENPVEVANEKGEKYRITVMFRHGTAKTITEADAQAEEKKATEPEKWKRGEKHPGLEKVGAAEIPPKAKPKVVAKKVKGERSNKEGVEFYNPFNVKTRNKVIEGRPNRAGHVDQCYDGTYFTQGHYAVKLPEVPDTKHDLKTGEAARDIPAAFPDEKDLAPAYILGEYKPNRAGVTLVHAMTPGQQDTFFNADYVDVILTRYPDAKLSTTPFEYGGSYGVFEVDGEAVGLVMSTQLDVSEALENIQRIKSGVIAADTEKLLKETDSIGDITLGGFVKLAIENPGEALKHIKAVTVPKNLLIEALKNKGMAALGKAPKSERPGMRKNLTATLEGIEKAEIPEPAAPDIKLSKREEKDLVAYHNLNSRDLIASDDLGGMPMPSLAITGKDFPYEPFGDITLIGSAGMVDPEGTFNRVFDSDTYSPTVPMKKRDLKRKPFDELWNRLSSKIGDVGDYIYSLQEAAEKGYDQLLHHFDNSNGLKVAFLREQGIPIRIPMEDIGFEMPFSDTEAVREFVKGYKGNIWDVDFHSPEHKALSVAVEKGVDEALGRDIVDDPEYRKITRKDVMDTWFDEEGYAAWGLTVQRLIRDAKLILKPGKEIDKSALRESLEKKFTKKITANYLEWTKKQIGPLYGDPYLKVGKKKIPFTLENVFDAMHRQSIRGGQDLMTFGPGKARAMGSKEFRTLDEVRKHKAALVHHDEFEKLLEAQTRKRESLTNDLAYHYQYKDWQGGVDTWASINDSMRAIGIFLKSPKSKQTPRQMNACLGRRGFKNVEGHILKDAVKFAETLRDMPTEYFEVKPERIVNIGEFSGAALPKNVDPAVKAILKKHGVPFKIYKTWKERQEVTASFQRKKGVLFSEEPAIEPAKEERLTADTAGEEIAKHIGKKPLGAMIKSGKIRFVTPGEAVKITGGKDLRESGVQGFYSEGITYLIPENIDVGRAWNVLMHELGVHHGYNKIFGEKLAKEVFACFVANNGKQTKLGRAVSKAMSRVPYETPPYRINEEAVAYFTEENANIDLAIHRKIIARMRLWAVKYFGVKPDCFTHDDYVALAASAIRGEVKTARVPAIATGVKFSEADIRYSKKEQVDLQAWADDLIKGAKDKGVVMDKKTPSPERLRETSLSILAGLNMQKLDQPARSFLEGMSPKGKGYGAAIEKWLASPEWYQHPILKKIISHALNKSEKFHNTFNEFNAVDDPFAEHDTVAKTLETLARKGGINKAAFILGRTSADFKKLETLLDDADVYGGKHTVEELKKEGYSEDAVHAWSVVRESYDRQLEALIKPMKDLVAKIQEQAAFMGTEPVYPAFGDFIIEGKKRKLTLQEAVMEMGRYKGTYSPRIRERGAWVVTGKKEGVVAEGGDEYFRNNRKTKSFANLLRDDLKKQGYTNVKVEKESRLPEETFQAVRMAEMGTMIGQAASKGLDKYDGEMQMAFMDEVVTASADLIKSRGARSTMIRRREGMAVKGYITNPLVRFVRYTGTNAAGIAKAEMAEKMIKDLYGEYVDGKKVGGIDAAKEGEIHSLARSYIEEQLRNAEAGDRIVGIMKGLTTLKFLGFNPRSVLVNMTALTTSVPMALHTYVMDGKGSLLKIGKTLSWGCKDYTKIMAGRRLKDIDEMTFMDSFRANGYTDAQYTRDATGVVQGAYGTAWSKLMSGSMFAFGKSEEWVRGGTALTAYRLCRKQGLSHVDAEKKAVEATAKAHGTYGKETLPMVAWGKGVGRLGQAFYTYLKFPHNYLQMLYDAGIRKKNIKGVIFGLAAPAVLGGVAAVPMYSATIAIANALMSLIDDDRDAEKLVYDTLNEYMGETGEKAIRSGVLGLIDVDISGSLSMGPGAIPSSLFDLTGAVGGMAQDIYRGGKFAIEGEYGRAFEKLMPKAIGNIALAIRETREGATTGRGDRVWDEEGRPYIPTPSETAKRALGFRSARRAMLAQTTWVTKKEERRFKETKSSIYRKIKYLTAGSENVRIDTETSDRISEYNKNALKTSNITLISPASIEYQIARMETPTSKQKARATQSKRAATFEGDIWAGALGVTDDIDGTQLEVKRLSDLGILKYSAPPSRNINAGYGIEVKLDDDQYSRYVADTSAIIKQATDRLLTRPEWRKWNDKKKAFAVKRVINKGRKIVRDRLKITILKARLKRR